MQTVRVKTAQNIDIDYEVAGIGERLLARLIDFGVFVCVYFLALIVYVITRPHIGNVGLIVVGVAYAALFVFYDLICEILMNGQCVGKRIMKIKVISLDGTRPTFGQYLLRWMFRIVDFTLSMQVCGLITAAVTEKQQRVGDIVAGTTLIKTEPRTKAAHLVFSPVANGYEPVFKELSLLNDRDIALIQEVVRSYRQTGNRFLLENAAKRVREILAIPAPEGMNDLKFLQTIVKDYSYMAAQAEA